MIADTYPFYLPIGSVYIYFVLLNFFLFFGRVCITTRNKETSSNMQSIRIFNFVALFIGETLQTIAFTQKCSLHLEFVCGWLTWMARWLAEEDDAMAVAGHSDDGCCCCC